MLIFHNTIRQLASVFVKSGINYNSRFSTTKLNLSTSMEQGKITLKKVVAYLENFADPSLAEPWDNVGLLVEPTQPQNVSKVLITNDLTQAVLEEALACKTDLIISYHPPIFAPLKRITQSSWKEKIIATCLENRIAVYSPHTAWDATNGAMGDFLASAFGNYSSSVQSIIPNSDNDLMFDVITSSEHIEDIQKLVPILYSLEGATPDKKICRIIAETKIAQKLAMLPETIVTKVEQLKKNSKTNIGMGRKVQLKEPGCTLSQCVELVKSYTGLSHIRLSKGIHHNAESIIKTVALVAGSGGSLLKGINADLFVTGEMFHHDLLDASHRGVSVILTNHSDSERPFLKCFREHFISNFPTIDVKVSSMDRDPIETV